MKEYLLFGLLAYICFCLAEIFAELYDRFVLKQKICRLKLSADDYSNLKKVLKNRGYAHSVDYFLQFHFQEDVKDYLECNLEVLDE